MVPLALTLAVLLGLWLVAELKTGRSDGDLLPVHPYRRLMFTIMPTRNESVVYFDAAVDADPLLQYVEAARARFDANLTHVAVAATGLAIAAVPSMNRFVVGQRLYQRRGRFITFAMKRKKLDREASLATLKLEVRDGETFRQLTERINADIRLNRSGERTAADREFDLFNLLPRPLLAAAARLLRRLDHYNLLPPFFIRDDPMYTSVFLANLGSIGLDAGYHHLYEYGTCSLFVTVGAVREEVVVAEGQPAVRRRLPLRFTYDERVDDGLNARYGIEALLAVLSDPAQHLGCLAEDGSDSRPLRPLPAAPPPPRT